MREKDFLYGRVQREFDAILKAKEDEDKKKLGEGNDEAGAALEQQKND
jgi:hypothetical protein